jgi:predicted transcriptional regulator
MSYTEEENELIKMKYTSIRLDGVTKAKLNKLAELEDRSFNGYVYRTLKKDVELNASKLKGVEDQDLIRKIYDKG